MYSEAGGATGQGRAPRRRSEGAWLHPGQAARGNWREPGEAWGEPARGWDSH